MHFTDKKLPLIGIERIFSLYLADKIYFPHGQLYNNPRYLLNFDAVFQNLLRRGKGIGDAIFVAS